MRARDLLGNLADITYGIILLADSQPDSCWSQPGHSELLNVDSVKSIIDDLNDLNVVPVFASTEFVFDGSKGNYTEEDETNPILVYGRQKLEIESYLATCGMPHMTFRFAKIYGDEAGDGTIFVNWLQQLKAGVPAIRCAADQAFSPVHVGDVAETIKRAIESDLRGLYHLSGNRRFQRIELLEMLIKKARQFISVKTAVEPCSINDFDLPEDRPLDVSMCSDKISNDVGMQFADAEQICEQLARQEFP